MNGTSLSNNEVNQVLLNEIKNLVIDVSNVSKKKLCCFSNTVNNEGFCEVEKIFLKKNLDYNNLGILITLSEIKAKYGVDIPYFENDISIKDIHDYIVNQKVTC